MDDLLLVRVMQRVAQVRHDVQLVLERERQRRLDPRGQAAAAEELHHDVRRRAVVGEFEDRDDVAVLELGDRARLAIEPRAQLLFVVGEIERASP